MELDDEFLKACITRESTKPRRHSASNMTSFREEARSFRHTPIISSTSSSPGYASRDLIDPSKYSFTAALKALQTRSGRESLLSIKSISNGNYLHSKWNEAERYICNPLSGQVPMECLSAKTLSGRSLANSRRITMSAPLVFSHARIIQTRPTTTNEEEPSITELENCKRIGRSKRIMTRDVGTQSTPPHPSSRSTSPDSAPPIKEISVASCGMEGEILSFHEEEPKPKGYEVKGKEIQIKIAEQEQGNETFKCKLGSCLPWGLRVKKQQKGEKE